MKAIKKRIAAHFKDDDLPGDILAELSTICAAVVQEVLARRTRRQRLRRHAKKARRRS